MDKGFNRQAGPAKDKGRAADADMAPADDNHTIADMSAVRGSSLSPRDWGRGRRRDVREELMGGEEERMVILGTLRAALSVGMVYVVVFGLAIALMLWLWT